jgi:hypothetical protein
VEVHRSSWAQLRVLRDHRLGFARVTCRFLNAFLVLGAGQLKRMDASSVETCNSLLSSERDLARYQEFEGEQPGVLGLNLNPKTLED